MAYDDPFSGLIQGQQFVNGLFDQQARKSAGIKVAAGDYAGAAADLGGRGMLDAQDALQTRGTTRTALTDFNAGDVSGAKAAAATGGDTSLYSAIGEQQRSDQQDRAKWLGNATDALLQVPQDQRHAAFQAHVVPVLKAMGLPDDQIAQVDASGLDDQSLNTFKTSLSGVSQMDIHYGDNGEVLGTDRRTGAVKVLHQGAAKPVVVDKSLVDPTTGKVIYSGGPEYKVVKDAEGNESIVALGGDDGAGAAAGATPAKPAPSGGVYDSMAGIAGKLGATPTEQDYLRRTMQIESSGNANAKNGASTGYFQFHPDTFSANGGSDINSLADQTKAALNLTRNSAKVLQANGQPITASNLYLVHQQGAGGAPALLKAADGMTAVDALTPVYEHAHPGQGAAYARAAVLKNGGTVDMSASDFVSKVTAPFGGQATADDAGGDAKVVYRSGGGAGGKSGGLTDDAIDRAARLYAVTGQLPALSRGKAGQADREEIINRSATLGGPDITQAKAQYGALNKSLGEATSRQTAVQSASKKALDTLDEAIAFAEGKQKAGAPVIEKGGLIGGFMAPVSAFGQGVTHNADYTHFKNLVEDAATEGAVAISNAKGGGSTDASRRELLGRMNASMTLDQIKAARSALATVLEKAQGSSQATIDDLSRRIDGILGSKTAVAPGSAAPAPKPQPTKRPDPLGIR